MGTIVVGSIWFLLGGLISLSLIIRVILALRKKAFTLTINLKKVGLFALLMVLAQIIPSLLMTHPGLEPLVYLWPVAYALNLLIFRLLLAVFGVRFEKTEKWFFLFPLVPGIVFWIVQRESRASRDGG
jgi:hypothetical protein